MCHKRLPPIKLSGIIIITMTCYRGTASIRSWYSYNNRHIWGHRHRGELKMTIGLTIVEQIEHHWTWRSRGRGSESWCGTRRMERRWKRRRIVSSSESGRDLGTESKIVIMCSRNRRCACLYRIRHMIISQKKESRLTSTCILSITSPPTVTLTKWSTPPTTSTPTSTSSRSSITRPSWCLKRPVWLPLPNHWAK